MANWIEQIYPIGARVVTPDGNGWVVNHTCEGGFKGSTTLGIIVELDSGDYLEVDYLTESGEKPEGSAAGGATYLYQPTVRD